MDFRLPDATSRVSISGMTGSGKSLFALWLFSFGQFDKRPYVIVDYKHDNSIKHIPHLREISLHEIPKHPGLYVLRPRPDQETEMNAWLWKVWAKGNIGLWFDEAYMVKNDKALNAILTQGRSLKIPCIILTQRPTNCSRFVFSEANYFAVFHLNDKRDYETIAQFTPRDAVFNPAIPLPRYACRWYDVAQQWSCILQPVASEQELLEKYDDALSVKIKGI